MLIDDLKIVGDNLYKIRSKKLLSRSEVVEKADLSERTYADIERGKRNRIKDTDCIYRVPKIEIKKTAMRKPASLFLQLMLW